MSDLNFDQAIQDAINLDVDVLPDEFSEEAMLARRAKKTDSNSGFAPVEGHPETCRCKTCLPDGGMVGLHPSGCQCEKCLEKGNSSSGSLDVDEEGVEGIFQSIATFMDSRFDGVANYKKIKPDEIKICTNRTMKVLEKYESKTGDLTEISLIVAVGGVFGSRILELLYATRKTKNKRSRNGVREEGVRQNDLGQKKSMSVI